MDKSMVLTQLKNGEKGIISNIESNELRANLLELGLTIGSEVHMLYRAPLGDPLAIEIQGTILSMRESEADLVKVIQHYQAL